MSELLDDEGENKAVRGFLLAYGTPGMTVAKMKTHMRMYGYPLWPAWVEIAEAQGHLTKAGAQSWLRHLFELESAVGDTARDGCDYCRNPLFAGRKCKNCGKVHWEDEYEAGYQHGLRDGRAELHNAEVTGAPISDDTRRDEL